MFLERRKLVLYGLVCSFFVNAVVGYVAKVPEVVTESDEVVVQKWKKFESELMDKIFRGFRKILPRIMEASSNADQLKLSDNCTNSMFKMITAVKEFKIWPIQMLDAMGKPEGGEVNGATAMMGNFDECLDIEVPSTDPKKPGILFTGQYCTVTIRPPLPSRPETLKFIHFTEGIEPLRNFSARTEGGKLFAGLAGLMYEVPLRMGLCVPSTCSQDDLKNIAEFASDKIDAINIGVESCQVKNESKNKMIIGEIAMSLGFVGFFALLVIVGTVIDIKTPSTNASKPINTNGEDLKPTSVENKPTEPSAIRKVFMTFSLRKNVKTLTSLQEYGDQTFSCFQGMRFFSMCWVLLGHSAMGVDFSYYRNVAVVQGVLESFWMQGIVNGFPSVDTFFFIASVLFSYIMIKTVDKRGIRVFNVPIIFIRRYLRLLPAELAVLIISFILPILGQGPFYDIYVDFTIKGCRNNWWTIFAFVANFFSASKEPCHMHFWYVSMDLQLFVLALLYMMIFFRSEKLGRMFNIFLVIASIIASFTVAYVNRFPPVFHQSFPNFKAIQNLINLTYLYPHNHSIVYGIGLLLGTYLARNPKIHVPKPVQVAGWLLSVPLGMAPVYITSIWHDNSRIPGELEGPLYVGFFRLAWCLSLSWVTLMCATGRGGIINDILSWKGYLPLNKLSYLVYLVHVFIMQSHYASLRGTTDTNRTSIIWGFFGLFATAYMSSTLLFLMFELPISNLEGLAFARIMKRMMGSRKPKEASAKETGDNAKINNAITTKENNSNEKQHEDMNGNVEASAPTQPQEDIDEEKHRQEMERTKL